MKNYDFKEKQFQIHDPIESYFECISNLQIKAGIYISKSSEISKEYANLNFIYYEGQ